MHSNGNFLVDGRLINPDRIDMIDFRNPDSAIIHVGPNSLTATGNDNARLRAALLPAEEKSDPEVNSATFDPTAQA